jgi:hypothetical protein
MALYTPSPSSLPSSIPACLPSPATPLHQSKFLRLSLPCLGSLLIQKKNHSTGLMTLRGRFVLFLHHPSFLMNDSGNLNSQVSCCLLWCGLSFLFIS